MRNRETGSGQVIQRSHRTEEARAFAPASISNIGCGYDVFGMALDGSGDVVSARLTEGRGIVSLSITGDGGRLPTDPSQNSAAVAAEAVLAKVGTRTGLALALHKGVPLASGLGGSAASAVAGAVAADAVLSGGLDQVALLECALQGEQQGSGATHPDNAAPALAGGFVLVPPGKPSRIVHVPLPPELAVAVARPHLEVETARARVLLGDTIALSAGVRQWGNAAGLVAALYEQDWELIGRCIADAVAEPVRAALVPGFETVRRRALESGAAGAGLSGSGPSVFAICRGMAVARPVAAAMASAFRSEAGVDADVIVSPGAAVGARVLKPASGVAGTLGS